MKSRSETCNFLRAFIAVFLAVGSLVTAGSNPNRPDVNAAVWDYLVSLAERQSAAGRTRQGKALVQEEPSEVESLIDSLIDGQSAEPNQVETPPEQNEVPEPYETTEPNAVPEPNYPPEPQAVPAPRYPASEQPAESTISAFGRDWKVNILGTAAFGDSQGELYTAHVGFESLIWRSWSLSLEPFAGVGVGQEDTAAVYGFDQILKYPLWTNGSLTWNFEGGGGIQFSGPDSWPDDSTHYNFRAILGGGVEYETAQNQRLLFGARWLHVGNLDIDKDKNPEVNELMLYGGWRLRF